MFVEQMMQQEIVSVPPDTSLADALEQMQEHNIRHLPVVSGHQIIGLLSDRDCRQAMPSSDVNLSVEDILEKLDTIRIDTCMTSPVITVPPEMDSVEAARQLLDHEFDCLPVVQHDQLVGILTATDFLRGFLASASLAEPGRSVRDYMQMSPISVTPSDHVRTAYHRMRCAHIRHLPVVTVDGLLVGVLTDRDIRHEQGSSLSVLAAYEWREPTETLTVNEIMRQRVVTVGEATPVAEAGDLLLRHRLGCLPVVSSQGVLEGIVTLKDMVRGYVQQHDSALSC